MKTRILLPVVATVFSVAYGQLAVAAERQIEGLVAGAAVHYGEDDNVFQQETLEFDSKYVEFTGAFGYGAGSDVNFIELLAEVNHRDYDEAEEYELSNVDFTSVVQWQPDRSHTFELHGGHHRVEENQDQTNRARDGATPASATKRYAGEGDEYFYSDAGVVYHIGHKRNLIAAKVGVNHQWRRYLNNRRVRAGATDSSNNALKDRDVASANGALYYQFSPSLRVVLAGQYDKYDYNEVASKRNAENISVVGGLEWETESAKAWLRGGTEDKEFDAFVAGGPSRDGDMGVWQVGYVGRLSPFVDVEFTSDARLIEGTDIEDYVEQIATEVKLNAALMDGLILSLGYNYTDEQYVDTTTGGCITATAPTAACYNGREDTIKEVLFNLHYNFIEDLAVGVEYRFTERESNLANYSFDRNIVSVYLESAI